MDLSDPDVAAIVQIAKDFSEAYKQGDAKRIADFYSPEVVYIHPGMADMKGRQSIEDAYRNLFARSSGEVVVTVMEVKVFGDLAYDWARFRITSSPKAGGPPRVLDGQVDEILRKENGTWKSYRVRLTPM